ncbi:MAG: alpha/beta hydrolase [Campylobacterota bacterium]|nr:alpha/beta hydrolase [Campylobacterota bacterium]
MLQESLRVMLALISAYGVVVVLVFLTQSSLVFFPMRSVDVTPKRIGLDFEEVRLETRDGVMLSSWFVPAKEQRGVLLFCHGNAGNISHRLESIRIFHDLGLSVLIFDYRGYGQSEGSISEEGTYLDAEAAWEYLAEERHVDPSRIILFGRSIGGAVAARLAAKQQAGALILESSFTSITDLGAQVYPYLPIRLLSRYHYDTSSYLQQIDMPLLIIHSPDDEIIPFTHAEALYERADKPKDLLQIMGDHNAGFFISGEHYINGIDRFLSTLEGIIDR